MANLEMWLWTLCVLGLVLGSLGIIWERTSCVPLRVLIGRGLFIATLLTLGVSSLVAAFHRAEGLVPMGLLAGCLVVAMLWEAPISHLSERQVVSLPE